MYFLECTNYAVLYPFQCQLIFTSAAPGQKMSYDLFPAGRFNGQPSFRYPVGNWLMGNDVLSFLHGSNGYRSMKMVRCHDFYGIQVFFLLEQFTEILIRITSLVFPGRQVFSVILFHIFPAYVTPSGNTFNTCTPSRVIQCSTDAVSDAVRRPINVIGSKFIRVAYCHDLHIRVFKHTRHFTKALCAASDIGNGYLITRSYIIRASQYVPGNHCKRY
ncbi:hypothetical protein ES703_116351 [subsurface metagenome]